MKFDTDEIILKKSRANHAVPGDVSGGKLFLTNKPVQHINKIHV